MIIVAGGSGTRMGAEIPKQFIELNGKPILMHTLQGFQDADNALELVLVLPSNQFDQWKSLCAQHKFNVPHAIATGGETRFLSVQSGLSKVENSELVGVHDGVRPFASSALVNRCFEAAQQFGAAIPVTPVVQSLRKVNSSGNSAVNRSDYVQVQTPQCFQTSVLRSAFENANGIDFSDDAAVVEANGGTITLVDGEFENIKITTPLDLELADLIITRRTV